MMNGEVDILQEEIWMANFGLVLRYFLVVFFTLAKNEDFW
jgi:hypothetical protein